MVQTVEHATVECFFDLYILKSGVCLCPKKIFYPKQTQVHFNFPFNHLQKKISITDARTVHPIRQRGPQKRPLATQRLLRQNRIIDSKHYRYKHAVSTFYVWPIYAKKQSSIHHFTSVKEKIQKSTPCSRDRNVSETPKSGPPEAQDTIPDTQKSVLDTQETISETQECFPNSQQTVSVTLECFPKTQDTV